MALDKQGNFSQQPSELPDVPSPSMTPDQIRAKWQTPLDELKATMNNAFDKLNGTGNGTSGAYNVGATDWDGVTASTVGALLSWLKANKTDLTGDHKGTWQGYTPRMADPGISSVVEQHTSQLADMWTDAKVKGLKCDGTDETATLQSIVDNNDNILIPADVSFSTITLTRTRQKIMFQGKITIVNSGKGIVFGTTATTATDIEVYCKYVLGDTLAITNGVLSTPTQNSAFLFQNSNFCKVYFNRIEGFKSGLLWATDGNGQENKIYAGVLQLCDKGIDIQNTTGTSAHEGNFITGISVFNCNTGISVPDKSKYQFIQGVVDCSGITNAMDVVDNGSANIYQLYYVRGTAIQNNQESMFYIFNNVTGNFIKFGNNAIGSYFMDIYDPNARFSWGDASNSNAYRMTIGKTLDNQDAAIISYIGDGSVNTPVVEFLKNGHFALPNRIQADFGGNFLNFNIANYVTSPAMGQMLYVVDSNTQSIRLYVYLYSKWNYVNFSS